MKDFAEYSKNLPGGCAQCRFLQRAVFAMAIGWVGAFAPLFPVCNLHHSWRVLNFSSAAIFTSSSFCWLYGHYVCCWKIRLKNGMSKKKRWRSKQTTGCGNTTWAILVTCQSTCLWCFAILPTNCGNGRAWSSLLVLP